MQARANAALSLSSSRCWLFIAMLGAASLPLFAFGPRILDVGDIGWLLAGPLGPDPVSYWVGWTYFRRSPWSVPPGLNPDWGLELSSSIFYADAVPLLALPLKALQPWVEVQQYWGLWLVVCAALQAAAAWWLIGRATRHTVARGAGAVLFAAQPMLLNRMGGHFALAAHWLVLAALALAVRPPKGPLHRRAAWSVLVAVASLTQAYLLAMVVALWAADLIDRVRRGERALTMLIDALTGAAFLAVALWAAGFFELRGGHAPIGEGYGMTALDLLAPFDPVEWGRFLPELQTLRHWEHGGSYLGLGSLLVLAAGLVAVARGGPAWRPVLARHAGLLLALVGLLVFAIGNRPAIGGVILFEVPLPELIRQFADLLRASERFVWPFAYASLFAAMAAIAARWGGRAAAVMLLLAVPVQLADISVGLVRQRSLVAEAPREPLARLVDPFWEEAARRYRRLRAVPAENFGLHWESLARFAVTHGLPTDAVYLSRVDGRVVARLRVEITERLAAGRFEEGTLYVLRDAETVALARAGHNPARDLLGRFDDIDVLAPGWFAPR